MSEITPQQKQLIEYIFVLAKFHGLEHNEEKMAHLRCAEIAASVLAVESSNRSKKQFRKLTKAIKKLNVKNVT